MSARSWCAVAALAAALGVFGVKSVSAQCMYEIEATISTPGCPPFGNAPIYAAAMNDHGVVVGHYIDCAFNEKPFMWSKETGFAAIPLPQGVSSAEPMDINNNGEIVGSLFRPGVGGRGFRYLDGVWTELQPTGGGNSTSANGINEDGWAAGHRDTGDTEEDGKAVRWLGNIVEELSSAIPGDGARANAINESTVATGTFGGLFNGRAFLWQGDRVTVIPPVAGGISSDGRAINNMPAVTGQSFLNVKGGSYPRRSWVFQNGELTDLGTLPDADHRTIAEDINNARQIVGTCSGVENATDRPFLWQHGEIHDLRSLIVDLPAGAFLERAFAINDRGEIVVEDTNAIRLLVLAPVDRPLGDINFDCVVDERDLLMVLDDWGPDGGKVGDIADIVTNANFQPPGDGRVDGADLAVVLGNWNASSAQIQSPMKGR